MKMIKQPTIPPMPKRPAFDARDTQYNLPIGTDCISRQAAIDAVNCVTVMKGIRSGKSITAEAVDCAKRIIADNIRQLPPIQPKRGKWIKISPANIYECSECGKSVMTNDICAYDFCHGCGADMREVTECLD